MDKDAIAKAKEAQLFEAFQQYVTQGRNVDLEEELKEAHLEAVHMHANLGDYLRLPSDATLRSRIWKHESSASGVLSTDKTNLTLSFNAKEPDLSCQGNAKGSFPPQQIHFSSAKYYYDDPLKEATPVKVDIKGSQRGTQTTVYFYPERHDFGNNNPIGKLVMDDTVVKMTRDGANGNGKLTPVI